MKLSQNVRKERDNHYVILINIFNGLWYRMTSEVYDALNLFLSSNVSEDFFINECVDPSDKEYFEKTIAYLKKIEILQERESYNPPESIGFAITHRCNLKCKHCSYDAGDINDNEKISDDKVITILNRIIELKPETISITGGEPLVRNNFAEILKVLEQSEIPNKNLMTNGLLINEKNIFDLLRVFNSFDISIDGVDEETCSLIRGNGVFNRVVKNVEELIQHGANPRKISLSMVLSSENEKNIEHFYRMNEKMGTNPVVRNYSYLGRGELNADLFNINISGINTITPDITEFTAMNCGAAQSELYIDCDGQIYPCPMILNQEFSMGNVLSICNIKEFFSERKHFESEGYKNFLSKYMPENYKPCKQCKSKYFCVKCPVQHFQYMNRDIKSRYCEIKKEMCSVVWRR